MQIALEIARLETLPIEELRKIWKQHFKTECNVQKKGLLRFSHCLPDARIGIWWTKCFN